jgi:hypothetical protein
MLLLRHAAARLAEHIHASYTWAFLSLDIDAERHCLCRLIIDFRPHISLMSAIFHSFRSFDIAHFYSATTYLHYAEELSSRPMPIRHLRCRYMTPCRPLIR